MPVTPEQIHPFYLVRNPQLMHDQLNGKKLVAVPFDDLMDGISTDAIIPSSHCFQDADPNRLGKFCLTGIPGDIIKQAAFQNGEFDTLVAGSSFGRGSSREHAQLALQGAGFQRLVLKSAERIFSENCLNYGIPIYPIDNEVVRKALSNGQVLPEKVYQDSLPPISLMIAQAGGLLPFMLARSSRKHEPVFDGTPGRPMTTVEKIIAGHAGIEGVKPGQQHIVRIDRGYAYELQTIVSADRLTQAVGGNFRLSRPEDFVLFEDHLALLENNPMAVNLRVKQREFANKFGVKYYPFTQQGGVEGICHTVMVERHCLPGELVLGNDSHTCTLGVLGALAVGKGASEMAAAMISGELVITVPESISFELVNSLPPGVTSKDLMLSILGMKEFRENLVGSGRVFEFSGSGLSKLSFDDQLVLANMAIEGQGYTGIVRPNSQTFEYLKRMHGQQFDERAVYSDPNAEFAAEFTIGLDTIEPMISLPGDTQNTIPLSDLNRKVDIDVAYIGSCTGGKLEDLKLAAEVLRGKKVNPNVRMYVQASSQRIRAEAERLGIFEILRQAGAVVLNPGCGACMGAGPGSTLEGEVMISDTNRNFYGRTGKGDTYLSNPALVASSAIKGYISEAN